MADTDQNIDEVVEDVEELDEGTAAANTLKPGSTKSEMLSKLISATAGMKKQDLSAFLEKTLNQVGGEDGSIPDGTAAMNLASISAGGATEPSPINHSSVKEDVDEMLASEDLSEEFKGKASTIFEAALNSRVAIETTRIEEEFEAKVEESVTEAVEELHEKVDEYLNYVVAEWIEENKIAIDNHIRTDIAEDFITGLKTLFSESYMEVPEDKIDLVDEMADKIESLESDLNEAVSENMELKKVITESATDVVFGEVSEGMTDTDVDKFASMCEGLEYTDLDEFKSKIEIIKEQYFTGKVNEDVTSSAKLIDEETVIMHEDNEEETKVVAPEVQPYVDAISRTMKRF